MTRRIYPNLRAFLQETGTTQQQFAARLGISQPALSKILNGHQGASLELALRISRLAGVPLESLVRARVRDESRNTWVQ